MTIQHSEPTDSDAAWDEFARLVNAYATKQALPDTASAALDEVRAVIHEIDLCLREGHTPVHPEIPWRVGYLVFCMHQVERVGLRDESARQLVTQFLDAMGIALAVALDIALVRLRALHRGEDMIHIDTHVLVPLMKAHLHRRS